jgi:putative intracellular protease/amidase
MKDLRQDADAGRLLTTALTSGKPLAIVCHALVAMMANRRNSLSPFADYRITAYTNAHNLFTRQNMDTKLEVVVVPVTDVDRAKDPYTATSRRLDATTTAIPPWGRPGPCGKGAPA